MPASVADRGAARAGGIVAGVSDRLTRMMWSFQEGSRVPRVSGLMSTLVVIEWDVGDTLCTAS